MFTQCLSKMILQGNTPINQVNARLNENIIFLNYLEGKKPSSTEAPKDVLTE